ncbi:hypothetical protein KBY28_09020 [Ruegeria pomeroyi]|nr:hypothetical protein [Ruegeria pomeroyi]
MFVCFFLLSAFAAAVLVPADSQLVPWILGLALLPMINLLFDWLSYGITIWLISRGHRKGGVYPLLSAGADLAAAAVLFGLLSAAILITLGMVNGMRAEPLVDLSALLAGLYAEPQDHLWVIAMVGSTLVPTFLHLCLAFLSLVTWARAGVWDALVRQLDKQKPLEHQIGASFGLTAILFLYIAVPPALIVAAGWSIWHYGGGLREAYVGGLINLADWMGYL